MFRGDVATAETVVVKVGTRVLTDDRGALDLSRIGAIAEQLAVAAETGRRIALVSSGAVGAGIGRLELARRPTDLAELQAVAAVGQSRLIEAYNRSFELHNCHAAQVLLTVDDFNERDRYLNIRNALLELFRFGAIPIVNENDTVRVDELERNVGDNDRLAAVVASMFPANLLVLLSDIDGLYDGDPSSESSSVLSEVDGIDASVTALVGERDQSALALSTGGMASKLEAARIATAAGLDVVIANGRQPSVVTEILSGAEVGTLFRAQGNPEAGRKRWIGVAAQPAGVLRLDLGAVRAIVNEGASLLAVGVTHVEGDIQRGDLVSLRGPDGGEIARGLSNYSVEEIQQIMGQPSEAIAGLLGRRPFRELIHRDNLSLLL